MHHKTLTGDQHQEQGVDVMSMEDAAMQGKAACLPAEPEGQTIEHHTEGIPAKHCSKGLDENG